MRRIRYMRLSGRQRFFVWAAAILVLTTAGAMLAVARIRPIITDLARSRTTNRVNQIVSDAVSAAIGSGEIDYSSLIRFDKDGEGKVAALRSNMTEFNRLQTLIAEDILQRLGEVSTIELSVPLGTLTGANLLAGRGPRLRVRMQSIGSATAKFRNALTASGINQTKHQVLLDVEVWVTILLPGDSISVQVSNELCVAETVIVGNVPQTYTYFSTTEDKIEDYADEYIMNNG